MIENGRIRQVGDFSRVQILSRSQVLDLTSDTVLPGLIMLHEHLVYTGNGDNELMRMMPFSAPRFFQKNRERISWRASARENA